MEAMPQELKAPSDGLELVLPSDLGDEAPVLEWFEDLVAKLGDPADSLDLLEAGIRELQVVSAVAWIPSESLPMGQMMHEVSQRMLTHMDTGVFAQVMHKEQALVAVLLELRKGEADDVHAGVAAQDGSAGVVDVGGGGVGAGGVEAGSDEAGESGVVAGGGNDFGAASPVPGA